MLIRLRWQKYLSVLQLTVLIILLCSLEPLTLSAHPKRQHQIEPPILKIGLIETLKSGRGKITVAGLLQRIKKRGVAFHLTLVEEQEIRSAGEYLGQKGLNDLIEAVRVNFRPPRNSPFRITYTTLAGYSIDLFLQGQISRRWNVNVGGNSYIIRNNTFKKLLYLVNTFTDDSSPPDTYYVQKRSTLYPRSMPTDPGREVRKYFVGAANDGGQMRSYLLDDISKLINSLNDPKQSWRVVWIDQNPRWSRGSYDADHLVFRKFNVERSDLEPLGPDVFLDYLLYITSEGLPPNFGFFELELIDEKLFDGCEAHASGPRPEAYVPQIAYYAPPLEVLVAVIENISKEPVSLENFIVKENDSNRLRPRDDDQVLLEKQPSRRQALFPRKTLEPGEKIAVPMKLTVGYNMHGNKQFGRPQRIPNDVLMRLKKSGGLIFSQHGTAEKINIKAEVIEDMANRPSISPPAIDYVYGPSVTLEAIEINDRDYIVRNYDPRYLLVTSENEEVGSCPYIYTYSAEKGTWLNEGVTLAGINEKYKESIDEKLLSRFDGRILIKEIDPEESFIDSMFIRAVAPDGNESILYPQNDKLRFSDGAYLRLKQGDRLIVNFDLPKNLIAHKYVLVTKGYYIRYKTAPARLITQPSNKLK
jgi:hypothetical protein